MRSADIALRNRLVSGGQPMRYGLIGCPSAQNWSVLIHQMFGIADYECEAMSEKELEKLLKEKNFDGINITGAYEKNIIRHADEMDGTAISCEKADTLANANGKLIGYNTEYAGIRGAISAAKIEVQGKKAVLIGNPDVLKAASAVLRDLGTEVTCISMSFGNSNIAQLLSGNPDGYQILVCGQDRDGAITEKLTDFIKRSDSLEAVIDLCSDALRSPLLLAAEKKGLRTLNSAAVQVYRAAASIRFCRGVKISEEQTSDCLKKLIQKKRNIVLIGMPTAGKTTVSAILSEKTGREAVGMDRLIEEKLGTSIRECFQTKGEEYFRSFETQTAKENSAAEGKIIDCGGGVVTVEDTMRWLCRNSLVIWLKRDLSQLYTSDSRPLSSSADAIAKMYEKRMPMYEKYADYAADNTGSLDDTVNEILQLISREIQL